MEKIEEGAVENTAPLSTKKEGRGRPKQWKAKQQFRDINNYSKVHKIGDIVDHTELREKLNLIE